MTFSRAMRPLRWRIKPVERRLILLVGDLIMAALALFIALYFWAQKDQWLNFSLQFLRERPPFWYYMQPLLWILLIIELYDVRRAGRWIEVLKGVGIAALISLGIYLLVYFTSEPTSLPRRGVAGFIIATAILTIFWRLIYINIFTAPQFMRRMLIIGAGRAGCTLAKVLTGIKPAPFFMTGLIDDDPQKIGTEIDGNKVLGGSQDLSRVIKEENISDLIFAISGEMNPEMFQSLLLAEEQGIEVTSMPVVYEEVLGRVPIFLLQSDWILRSFVDQAHAGGFYEVSKRLLDLAGGIVGLLILIPLYPLVAISIVLDSGFPVLYKQLRLGMNGRVYEMAKFRTMFTDAEKDGKARMAVENDNRVTHIGRILRKSHLDELPQFYNVLAGSMSLVGPRAERPELVDQLQAKIPFYRARLFVKPGLTGWAQTNFGYASSVEDTAIKLEYDLYYIKHRNLFLDLLILARTFGTMIGFRGL